MRITVPTLIILLGLALLWTAFKMDQSRPEKCSPVDSMIKPLIYTPVLTR